MKRRAKIRLLAFLIAVTIPALGAQQAVKLLVISSCTGTATTLGGPPSAGYDVSGPCTETFPAETNPPPIEPGQAAPFCTYWTTTGMSIQLRFTRTNAILTTEDGQRYSAVLHCERQVGQCPTLADNKVYIGKMNKKVILDMARSKPISSPPKIDLWFDGRHKVSYKIVSIGTLPLSVPHP